MLLNVWDTLAMGNFPFASNYLIYQQVGHWPPNDLIYQQVGYAPSLRVLNAVRVNGVFDLGECGNARVSS